MAVGMNTELKKDDVDYPKRLKHYNEIFVGHTPTTNYGCWEPMNRANIWNVDTGAAFMGKLSAICLNTKKVTTNLVKQESKEVDGIKFKLKREVKNGEIIKQIEFESKKQLFSYSERVQAITLEDFQDLFSYTNMKIIHTFGDYSLNKFDRINSDRLILIAKK